MSNTFASEPLGLVLQKADLISAEQIDIALSAQKKADNRKIGEILADKGWIKQETADFFAQSWPNLFDREQLQPIGQYLKAAALLNEEQIENILAQQQLTGDKFGAIAVIKGWLRQSTINFFIDNLELLRQWHLEKNSLLEKGITTGESKQLLNLHKSLLEDKQCEPMLLLQLYKEVWQQGSILATDSLVELELIKIGLIVKQNERLKVARSIYQSVFDSHWVDRELARLQPYGKIRLKLLNLEEKASLPYKLLTEIHYWTGNEPFLTQKLCQLINEEQIFLPVGEETAHIEELVQTRIVDNWQEQVAAEHLFHIQDNLLDNHKHHPVILLKLYKQIWQQGEIPVQHSSTEAELIEIGLIVKQQGKLKVANRIYQSVFNQGWIADRLAQLTDSSMNDRDRFVPVQGNRHHQTAAKNPILTIPPTIQKHKKIVPVWIWFSLIILVLIPSLFAFAYTLFLKSSEKKAFRQGNELLVKGEYQQALDKYDEVLRIDANYVEAWTNRGYAFAGLQKYAQMHASCSSATAIEPEDVYAWNCQGEALYNLKRYQDALAAFDRAIAIDSFDPAFWINKSDALVSLTQHKKALVAIDRAIQLLEAKKQSDGLDKVKGELTTAWSYKGKALLTNKQYQEALEAYERALTYSPEHLTALQGKGQALMYLKQYQEAQVEFDRILAKEKIADTQKAATLFYQGVNFCRAQNFSEAIAAFDRALAVKPDYQEAITNKASCQSVSRRE